MNKKYSDTIEIECSARAQIVTMCCSVIVIHIFLYSFRQKSLFPIFPVHLTNGHVNSSKCRIACRLIASIFAIISLSLVPFAIVNYGIRFDFPLTAFAICNSISLLGYRRLGKRITFFLLHPSRSKNRISIFFCLKSFWFGPFLCARRQMALCNVKLCFVAQTYISISLR